MRRHPCPPFPAIRIFTTGLASLLACLVMAGLPLFSLNAAESLRPPAQPQAAAVSSLTLDEADNRLAIADRMVQGGIFDRALELAESVLNDPAAAALEGDPEELYEWLQRREVARFLRERSRLGLASSTPELEDVAEAFVHLHNNRYRLIEPVYNVQAAYWAARAYEETGDYRDAVEYYSRVGGVSLPAEMEGDAAQRMSRCLRKIAEEIPFPGSLADRQRRDRLLNQAITELDRARLAFPIGNRRKEIELDRIALRMARREEQFVREAATEAEAYIESDPAKDELRARAALFRGQAAAMLGNPNDAAKWFTKILKEEAPGEDDARSAHLGLALALMEIAESTGGRDKTRLYREAEAALEEAIADAMSPGPWDGARIIKAQVQIELGLPTAALENLQPILDADRVNPAAWRLAGLAELYRGRLGEAYRYLYPATRPSNQRRELRYTATREASRTADSRRDFGLALALNHQAAKMLRADKLFSSLLVLQARAMETILKLGKMGGPISLSSDSDLLMAGSDTQIVSIQNKRREAARDLTQALGRLLWHGGDPDSGYDLAIATESAHEWSGDGIANLELAIGMISHLRKRQPAGVTDSILSSHLGVARHALALARAEKILEADSPDNAAIDRTLGDFAAAAASFQEASAGGLSLQDSLDQGMVNMESGAFLKRLADRWEHGQWAASAMSWREEARMRIEASLRPFNQAIANSPPSSLAARRAKWSRGNALELLGEWRGAAVDFLSLMNNSELPRILRANAARRWAVCMGKLGESRVALTRLTVFAETDAESALLAGHLAEEAGFPREAYQQYLFAAHPDSPSLPPATPGRMQDAAYHAARLALNDPNEADPLVPPEQVVGAARDLLETAALRNLVGKWTVPMLNLLGESWLREPGGGERAFDFARDVIRRHGSHAPVDRAMRILAAKALEKQSRYAEALDELDLARELLHNDAASRRDAALVTLETARIYRHQRRNDDALRAFADVFAMYPEQEDAAEDARLEAAVMLLTEDGAGQREREQARGILTGLRDQVLAEKIMRDYGIH